MKTYEQMVAEAKSQIDEIDSDQLNNMLLKRVPFVLLDIREEDEFNEGKIPQAENMPRGILEGNIEDRVPDRQTPIVVYCGGGGRGALAAKTLKEMGYLNAYNLAGGMRGYKPEKSLK